MENKKEEKPSICRIAKLKGFDNIIAGRDFAGIFKEGHVYAVYELMGVIMFKDLGEYGLPEWLQREGHRFGTIIMDGSYLLTKDELKKSEEQNTSVDTGEYY